jgi:plasmid stabilization system protein ParE
LPLFERDLADARDYIAGKLQNPIAADRLIEEVERAIKDRLSAPLSFKAYNSTFPISPLWYIFIKIRKIACRII